MMRRMADAAVAPPVDAPLGDVTTERLDLRRFDAGDLDELAAVFAEPAVWRFPYGRGLTRAETQSFLDAQLAHWDEHRFGCWIARGRDDGAVVGYVGLSVPLFLPSILPAVEVGWRLSPAVWGRGLATEGATAALDEAFSTLGLASVCSLPQVDNPASTAVADRLGMTSVGEVAIAANERRGEVVAVHYVISRAAWQRSRQA